MSKIGVCIQNAFLQIAAFVSLFAHRKLLQAMWFSQNAFFLQEKEGDIAKLSNCTRVSFSPILLGKIGYKSLKIYILFTYTFQESTKTQLQEWKSIWKCSHISSRRWGLR